MIARLHDQIALREQLMFERLFQWTSRNGSRILFAMALIVFAAQVINGLVIYFTDVRPTYTSEPSNLLNWRYVVAPFVAAFQSAALPLAAALIVERLKPTA